MLGCIPPAARGQQETGKTAERERQGGPLRMLTRFVQCLVHRMVVLAGKRNQARECPLVSIHSVLAPRTYLALTPALPAN